MAGMGRRFKEREINILKPLYLIKKKPIFYYAVKSLPKSFKDIFVCKQNDLKKYKLLKAIRVYFKKSNIFRIKKKQKVKQSHVKLPVKMFPIMYSLLLDLVTTVIVLIK